MSAQGAIAERQKVIFALIKDPGDAQEQSMPGYVSWQVCFLRLVLISITGPVIGLAFSFGKIQNSLKPPY